MISNQKLVEKTKNYYQNFSKFILPLFPKSGLFSFQNIISGFTKIGTLGQYCDLVFSFHGAAIEMAEHDSFHTIEIVQ